jgi:hypothetical protein
MSTQEKSSPGDAAAAFTPPHPGTPDMPRWGAGELHPPPRFALRNWFALVGPSLVMGGAAIGAGEWLVGPVVAARYGGAMLWLATLSILFQVIYNIEISRYTLYCGEPIFSGKFRTPPGPWVWLFVYLALDFGTVFPYVAANAATPLLMLVLGGEVPQPDPTRAGFVESHWWLHKGLSSMVFLIGLLPMVFGGVIYRSLKAVMAVKIVVVLGFLLFLAVFYSRSETWSEILGGFCKFGSVPVKLPEGAAATANVENVFVSLASGEGLPSVDWTLFAYIAALAAIAGSGGLTNTPISNYTRDQGWGMGHAVGAIPSLIGGRNVTLSHVGAVFDPTEESLPRWRRWYRHVCRDQLVVWMPACFVGIALPTMLSVEFLPRGTQADNWLAAGMTAGGVGERVANPPADVIASSSGLTGLISGQVWGTVFWALTLLCGFLVFQPTVATTIDGFVRRWVDVFWTSSRTLRHLDPGRIKQVYFKVIALYALFGFVALWLNRPDNLVKYATLIYNFALGFSAWHVIVINRSLLPRPLRPGWFPVAGLAIGGVFFTVLATLALLNELKWL